MSNPSQRSETESVEWTLEPGFGLRPRETAIVEEQQPLSNEAPSGSHNTINKDDAEIRQVRSSILVDPEKHSTIFWLTPMAGPFPTESDEYLAGLIRSFVTRPTSPERIHGDSYNIIRIFISIPTLATRGLNSVIDDIHQTIESSNARLQDMSSSDISTTPNIGGESFGASLVVHLLLRKPEKYQAAIIRSGCYERGLQAGGFEGMHLERNIHSELFQSLSLPTEDRPFSRFPPTHISVGQNDEITATDPSQSRGLAERLSVSGARVHFLELPGEGHTFRSVESIERLKTHERAWIQLHNVLARPRKECKDEDR